MTATKHEVWCVPGAQKTVAEKWAGAHEDLEQEPYVRVFGNVRRTARESHFDNVVKKKSKRNSEATSASGKGNTSVDELDEDEAQLVRTRSGQAAHCFLH